jgi:hypothetical protein
VLQPRSPAWRWPFVDQMEVDIRTEDAPMKTRAISGAVALTALITLASAAIAADQGATGTTSGPAAGGTVTPQTMQGGAAGVAGPAGSKNGPAQRSRDATTAQYGKPTNSADVPTTRRLQDAKTAQYGKATDSADVPAASGSKK